MCLRSGPTEIVLCWGVRNFSRAHHPKPKGCVVRGIGESMAVVPCLDVMHHDVGVAECRTAQHGLEAVDQCGIAAPVHLERAAVLGGLGGLQVGHDVATAEGVDGLLRITDEDHRRAATEGPFDDLPLHRVGVLEFVDHHDRQRAAIRVAAGAGAPSGPGSSAVASRLSRSSKPRMPSLRLRCSSSAQHVPGETQSHRRLPNPDLARAAATRRRGWPRPHARGPMPPYG